MTALVEGLREAVSEPQPAAITSVVTLKVTTLKAGFADLWPSALIVCGLVLTGLWSAGLLWLVWCVI
jgi:hypothetical protein